MGAKPRSLWQQIKQHPFIIAGIIVVVFALTAFTIAVIKFGWDWTGFTGGESKVTTTMITPGTTTTATPRTTVATEQHPAKTLWDWLGLLGVLAVPIVVGFGVAWFTSQQGKVSDRENTDNQREKALQDYIDKMSELLLEKHLRKSLPEDEARTIARVRTITILFQLDARRIGYVFAFLDEAGLMSHNPKEESIVSFYEANLEKINFSQANLRGANLRGANLRGAILRGAILRGAILDRAILEATDLSRAYFYETGLSGANLSGANLSGANLVSSSIDGADLNGADLRGTIVREEQLNEARSLKGATMPDGTKHD